VLNFLENGNAKGNSSGCKEELELKVDTTKLFVVT
jgi:hypothetical protein